jgi:hypothetical protein
MGQVQVGRAALSLSPLAGRGIGRLWRPSLKSTPKQSFGYVASAIRVRRSLRGFPCLPDSRMEPLTPTLSPQGRGEGVHLMRGDHP